MPGPEHFKNKEAERKYEAFIHIHDVPHRHHDTVIIAGHEHKLQHDPRHPGHLLK